LLLSLIEARRLDVLTVPLGVLAGAYLEALAGLEGDRIGNVSAFVAVASQLILIKSRAMLPRRAPEAATEFADEGGDPEAELRAKDPELIIDLDAPLYTEKDAAAVLPLFKPVRYDEVILLPNNANVILAAQQVPELTKKQVHLLPTRTVPQGIAAVVAFNPTRGDGENLKGMTEAKDQVQTIEVTHAVRDSRANGVAVKKGDVIALINDKLKHSGADYGSVVSLALRDIKPEEYELVTVYTGKGAEDKDLKLLTDAIGRDFPGLEVEVQDGGQQHYPFILSVE